MEHKEKEDVVLGLFIFFVASAIIGFLNYPLIKEWQNPPKPCEIDISYFTGRVWPQADINPGTFTIKRPFAEISKWGKDGILAFSARGSAVKLQAWRPNPTTQNVFDYTEKEIIFPWRLSIADKVIKIDKKLIAYPKISNGAIVFIMGLNIVLVSMMFGGLLLVIKALCTKKEAVV